MEKPLIIWQAHEGNISGANIAMLEYIDALVNDYNFYVILPHLGTMCQELQRRAVPYSLVPQYSWVGTRFRTYTAKLRFKIRSFIALQRTVDLFKILKPALVFTNTQAPFIAAKAARKLKYPHVWWIHEFGEEDFDFSIGLGHRQKAYKLMQMWSTLIVCNSNAVAAKFRKLLPGSNIYVNYQPVSWNASGYHNIPKGKFVMFGQLAPAKGHQEVIEAMHQCKLQNKKVAKVYFIGPCEDKTYLRELNLKIEKYGLEKCITIEEGFFIKEEVLPLFDVLIIASKSEAFGRVIIEAYKAGLKVVVKNSGGAPELLNQTNGLIYNNREELMSVLCGETRMPEGPSIMNYDEANELDRLKKVISQIAGL